MHATSGRRLTGLAQHLGSHRPTQTVAGESGRQTSERGITHSIVISGNPLTMEIGEDDAVVCQYSGKGAGESRHNSRDASKTDDGTYLVVLNDKVVEVAANKEVVWSYHMDTSINSELMGAQRLADGTTVVTECGDNPRVVEVDGSGRVTAEVPIQPETENSHQQSRMGRKTVSGTYLVPHRVNFVKEYDASGEIVHVFRTDIPEMADSAGDFGGNALSTGTDERSSFFASRLDDGSTAISCASGNRLCVFDKDHNLEWQCSNVDLGTNPDDGQGLNDVCGLQVLKSGNFLVSTYGNKQKDGTGMKMVEITREKEIVWTYHNPDITWVHTCQVLSTNGQPE
eukprot:COSAG02_NODE_7366_length_3045_cov_63.590971_2_plen_341_part_00